MADAMRAEMAKDPDRYRPVSYSMKPVGHCPCCKQNVHRTTSRHTNWEPGFATLGEPPIVHPAYDDATGAPDPKGNVAGCCCVAPNFGPAHAKKPKRKTSKRKVAP